MFRIVHASDIQVRNLKRHTEYKNYFENFYVSLREQKPDLIVLPGDLVHNKTNISPELVSIVSDFFYELSKIASVHIIPGNHDGNLYNLTRMDTLSPIIKALNIPTIHYYKKSGIYPVKLKNNDEFNFLVFSCFEDEEKWPKKQEIDNTKINIALFHGMIQGAKLQNGQIVEECPYKLRQFLDVADYLMLGDIHEKQYLDIDYRSAYCGSLIQQSFSETVNKGYLVWDIKSKFRGRNSHDVQFIELPTVCPFYTFELPDQLTVPVFTNIQKKARIRVFSRPLNFFEKKSIEDTIKSRYEPVELHLLEYPDAVKKEITINSGEKVGNLDSTETQENLIKEFLAPRSLTDSQLKKVFELNQKYSGRGNTEEDIKRNIQYKIKKMTFANTFSYGEDNVFDFSKYRGIIGIFGKNAVGKSSLVVDVPLYTIFNKISKKGVVKNDLIINESKTDCASEIEIQLGQDTHFIRRATHIFTKGKKDGFPFLQGKTEVDYKVIKADGTEEDKNGIERSETDKAIREVFGTPEDFMATSVAPQWQLLGIIDAGGTDRQKLIGRYFDINIFEEKNKMAKEDWKEVKTLLKTYQDRNFDQEEDAFNQRKTLNKTKLQQSKDFFKKCQDEIEQIEVEIKKIDHDAAKKQNNTFLLKSEKTKLMDKVVFLDKKIKETQKYSCIKNSDCCMLVDLEKNKIQKTELIAEVLVHDQKIIEQELENAQNESKKKLEELERQKRYLKSNCNQAMDDMSSNAKDDGICDAGLKSVEVARLAYEKIKQDYELYDYFLSATSKDGISKTIISQNLEVVNSEIKKILSNGVNFEIQLVSAEDGKAIEIFFKHEKSKPRRIELLSGMEKSISALAIRCALINITALPKSNVLILDEPFGSLDAEYKDAVSKILENIKCSFDSIFIITHDEYFKDIVDHVVEISRNDDGYSIVVQ